MGVSVRGLACLQLLAVVSTFGLRAHADEGRAQCAQAYEKGQEARRDGKFALAGEQLVACSQPKCGDAISRECTLLYSKLQEAMPSVVFGARDEKEQELVDVAVSIDGNAVQQSIDGHAVTLDPGVHTFRFISKTLPPVEKVIAIREGEKFRLLSVTIVDPHAPPVAAAAGNRTVAITTPGPTETGTAAKNDIPVASFVLGGVGVVGLAAFGYFRLSGISDFNSLKDTCSSHCTQDDVSGIRDKFVISNVALGVGAAALGGAAVVWLLHRSSGSQSTGAVSVVPVVGGGSAVWSGTF